MEEVWPHPLTCFVRFAEESRLRLHHVQRAVDRAEGAQGARAHARRQENRPQARDAQEQGRPPQQDQEDLRGRRESGDVRRGGQGLLRTVRTRRGGRHAHGPADQEAQGLRLRHFRVRGRGQYFFISTNLRPQIYKNRKIIQGKIQFFSCKKLLIGL
jgi:hypothetical protein